VTFASLNNLAKITPATLDDWAAILRATPGSRLLMKAVGLDESAIRDRFERLFADRGIDRARIAFEGGSPFAEYLQTFSRIDLLLDASPFNGHTTTCHGLWMGVPTVTLAGRTPVSRVGRSVLSSVALGGLSADSHESYVGRAVDLSQDRARLRDLRSTLRDQMRSGALGDGKRFTNHLEAAFQRMWQDWIRTAT
jgi:predicted O-linked N-acetylglucosamine transferase (SPINDLY family)